ncbi:hypothetical protein BH24ACI1_BH24ACI1_16920 [soil metagenome]
MYLQKPNPETPLKGQYNTQFKTGKIRRTDLELSDLGKQLADKFGFPKVDISVVKQGGAFDKGPWIRLK